MEKENDKDADGTSKELHSDVCNPVTKGKGPGTRKASHQRESGDIGRSRNKETNAAHGNNIIHSHHDSKGSSVAVDKGSKDDVTTAKDR